MFATFSDLRHSQILKAQSAETWLNISIVQITLVIDKTNTILIQLLSLSVWDSSSISRVSNIFHCSLITFLLYQLLNADFFLDIKVEVLFKSPINILTFKPLISI